MSSKLLEYSSRKVCARYYGQNQRFRSFSTVDPTTRKACRLLCCRKFRIVSIRGSIRGLPGYVICINPKGLEGSLSQEVKKRSKNHLHLWRLEMSTCHQHPK